jgi:nitrite reductase/ring-hydroxylating ferredoxin subunit
VADWTVSDGEDRRVGLFHGLLNGAATALQGVSLAARLTGHRGSARTLGAASMAVTTVAGFVGGHLVQGRGAMVNRVASNTGPTRWVKTLAVDDLPDGEPTGVDVEGRKVLLYREGETVHAIDDVCSHAGAHLSRGTVVDCVVTCPLHESQFDVRDGHIVRGPAHHPQPSLPSRVRNGFIEVRGSQPGRRRSTT